MSVQRRESVVETEAGFNLTPLIDCVFLLLIFFMVTTVFKNPAQLKMVLPDAENPMKLEKRQLICELDDEDNIALNGKTITLDTFDAELVSQKQITGNSTLLIKADVAAKHGTVLKLMKLARGVQIETIAMAVESTTEE